MRIEKYYETLSGIQSSVSDLTYDYLIEIHYSPIYYIFTHIYNVGDFSLHALRQKIFFWIILYVAGMPNLSFRPRRWGGVGLDWRGASWPISESSISWFNLLTWYWQSSLALVIIWLSDFQLNESVLKVSIQTDSYYTFYLLEIKLL